MAPPRRALHRLLSGALALVARPAPVVARLKCLLPAPKSSLRVLHVIGDSHASVFAGVDEMIDTWPRHFRDPSMTFDACRLGAVLAYSLPEYGTATRGREKLMVTLGFGPIPPRATIMLCFGEIDCRYHLLRQAESQHRDIEDVVAECAERYARVVLDVKSMGFSICVWGVVPANDISPEDADAEYPYSGTTSERNAVIRIFNAQLSARLMPHDVAVVSIFDDLIGPDGMLDRSYYMDSVHLSKRALPLAVKALSASPLVPWSR